MTNGDTSKLLLQLTAATIVIDIFRVAMDFEFAGFSSKRHRAGKAVEM